MKLRKQVKTHNQSPNMQRETEKQIKELEKNDIIEKSMSPYQSPAVLVKKQMVHNALQLITEN